MNGIIIAVIGSQAVFSFVQFLIMRHDQKKSTLEKAVLAILRDRLLHLCNKYIAEGEIGLREEEAFTKLYEAYTSLGGNSFVKDLYATVIELPKKA